MERKEFFATNTRTGQQFCFGRFENAADAQAHFSKHFRHNHEDGECQCEFDRFTFDGSKQEA